MSKRFCAFSVFAGPHGAPQPTLKTKAAPGQVATPWVVTGSEDGSVYVYGLNSEKVGACAAAARVFV